MEAGIVEIFFSFVPEESNFYHKLRQQLRPLERDGRIRCWSYEDVLAGNVFEQEILRMLNTASIIVPLISPAYLADDEHHQELLKAIGRHQEGKALVLPVRLKPVLDD